MFVPGKEVLDKARDGGYAVGAFNFVNMEMLQSIITAANEENSPVIIQTTEGAIKYAGIEYLHAMAEVAARGAKVPVVLHLDHGKDPEIIKRCIDIGYSSVMIDASAHEFEENARITKEIVSIAHERGVSVEAEIGTLAGVEDNVAVDQQDAKFTDPDQAKEFVEATGCDYLAIAIGTSHGMHKFEGETKLNYDVLSRIKGMVDVPLVLHGASGIPKEIVEEAIKYGAEFKKAHGVSDDAITESVNRGINKINVDSDIRLTFTQEIRKVLSTQRAEFDLRKILGPARKDAIELIKHKMRIFGCSGKG